ncbi:hypothetical protein KKG31_07700 [Patescibacteria group bacterium]|nr:hypothetical protein [Patescibacteria group bacterium]MBU1758949.1 hypothetical protein [Patescibacteria group bacterium]
MTDPFEDFAECFNLYLYHNALFKSFVKNSTTLKGKYNFIAGFFDGKYLRSTSEDLEYLKR